MTCDDIRNKRISKQKQAILLLLKERPMAIREIAEQTNSSICRNSEIMRELHRNCQVYIHEWRLRGRQKERIFALKTKKNETDVVFIHAKKLKRLERVGIKQKLLDKGGNVL